MPSQQLLNGQKELERRRRVLILASGPVRTCISSSELRSKPEFSLESKKQNQNLTERSGQTASPLPETVKAYPTILLALLHHNMAPAGRVYLLMRAFDYKGRGCFEIDQVRTLLTCKQSPWRICGWRRLRQIFNQAEGILWKRHTADRIWLRSPAKIAQTLDCTRLKGFPISLPVETLLQGISRVRANFYGSFHSGRLEEKPISRRTLRSLTGVAERTQRDYDKVAKVSRQRNMSVGARYSKGILEERTWHHGLAVFRFIDIQGKQGRRGQEYVAWHLPNSYKGPHSQCAKGRQKKINKQIDLVNIGVQGNGPAVNRLFHPDAKSAAKSFSRNCQIDSYWPANQTLLARYLQWYVMRR